MEDKQQVLLDKHKDIPRIDQEIKNCQGWYVRVRFRGKIHSKFFSDKKCGGKYSSLLSATVWRDKTERKLGKVRTDKYLVTLSNSSTGVVGVRLNKKLNRYDVNWVSDKGKQGRTSVSINKYGKKQALRRACSIRLEKENARLGIVKKN